MDNLPSYSAFAGWTRIASGSLEEMLIATKAHIDASQPGSELVLIFHNETGKQIDFDFGGSIRDVLDRALPQSVRSGPGRPRLGVTSREISLLPRHWEWLETHPQGASATLRRLVDEARKRDGDETQVRQTVDATGRFITSIAGNLPGFEEAYRSLYARDYERFRRLTNEWPQDVQTYVAERLDPVLAGQPA
jgi:uncharacterized protein